MRHRSLTLIYLIIGLLIVFSMQVAMADDPEWKNKQQALFEKFGLQPGEVVDSSNWNKIDGLVPESVLAWVKKGWVIVNIGEMKFDLDCDDKIYKATGKNAGKYKIDTKGNLITTATGKPPEWIDGMPFPDVDIKKDPQGVSKYMFNRLLFQNRMGQFSWDTQGCWVNMKSYERHVNTIVSRYFFWGRPDGMKENPGNVRYLDSVNVKGPYDMAGINQLTIRKLDGEPDDLYIYLPAIRRVKRMSGANRSDPYMGCDVCIDDIYGFGGQIAEVEWKFIEERVGLMCITDWAAEHTNKMTEQSDGSWVTSSEEKLLKPGYMVEGFKGAAWAPVNAVWVPRTFYVIQGTPKDRYYNYGKFNLWFDKQTYMPNYKVIWDKADEYWKTVLSPSVSMEWADMRGVQHVNTHIGFDERTKHAAYWFHGGTSYGFVMTTTYNSPKNNPLAYSQSNLRLISK